MRRIRVFRRNALLALDASQRVDLRIDSESAAWSLWADGVPVLALEPRGDLLLLTVGWPDQVQREVVAIAAADYDRLQAALDWHRQGHTYRASCSGFHAVLTLLAAPLTSGVDPITRWQAHIERADGTILAGPQLFIGGQGVTDGFFAAQAWIERELARLTK